MKVVRGSWKYYYSFINFLEVLVSSEVRIKRVFFWSYKKFFKPVFKNSVKPQLPAALCTAVDEPRGMAHSPDLQRERVDAARGLAHHRAGT